MQKVAGVMDIDAPFTRWTRLTDAYAEQLEAMAQGDLAARAEAARLCQELRRIQSAPGNVTAVFDGD
ncbi:MAG: hypothetical protein EOO29_26340 [Comamonadaceae bacterium]|nr:MAG: hypothetical protein EOO29_26340 [Comamonadaceae bacterium]